MGRLHPFYKLTMRILISLAVCAGHPGRAWRTHHPEPCGTTADQLVGRPQVCSCLCVGKTEAAPATLSWMCQGAPHFSVPREVLVMCESLWWWLVTKSHLSLVIPWTVAQQAPLSMEFSKQEY